MRTVHIKQQQLSHSQIISNADEENHTRTHAHISIDQSAHSAVNFVMTGAFAQWTYWKRWIVLGAWNRNEKWSNWQWNGKHFGCYWVLLSICIDRNSNAIRVDRFTLTHTHTSKKEMKRLPSKIMANWWYIIWTLRSSNSSALVQKDDEEKGRKEGATVFNQVSAPAIL